MANLSTWAANWDETKHPRDHGKFAAGGESTPAAKPTWTKNADGSYTHSFGATLKKVGKDWHLEYKGKTVKLPKRASFDHAERAMGNIAAHAGP